MYTCYYSRKAANGRIDFVVFNNQWGAVVDSNNLILRRRLQNSSSLIIIYSMLFYNITASIATRGDANAYSDVVRDLCSFTC